VLGEGGSQEDMVILVRKAMVVIPKKPAILLVNHQVALDPFLPRWVPHLHLPEFFPHLL